jgi:tetratricopeptide (TPR) repeat protein
MTTHSIRRIAAGLLAAGMLTGCSIDSLVDVKLPSSILDPNALQTYNGAITMYNGSLSEFNRAFMGGQQANGGGGVIPANFAITGGIIADEYTLAGADDIDRRDDRDESSGQYTFPVLAIAYVNAGQAIQYLTQYAPTAPAAYVARAHVNRGYLALFMSELFCSGVPLSEAKQDGSVVYGRAYSAAELRDYAIAQFDTALTTFGADTGKVALAARMGRARAYLNAKQYDKAAAEAARVPTSYRYDATYSTSVTSTASYFQPGGVFAWTTVADREGLNGLDFISANDPRVKADVVSNINSIDIYQPHAWRASGDLSIPVESGVNARLIEAEYLLSQGQFTQWLGKLNGLRAGEGGVAGLAPLADPGTASGRLQLTFRERAFWLFGTGHRQGDLRRLVRQYTLPQSQVFPTGAYPQGLLYGIYTNIGVGAHERESNANYSGCIDREA